MRRRKPVVGHRTVKLSDGRIIEFDRNDPSTLIHLYVFKSTKRYNEAQQFVLDARKVRKDDRWAGHYERAKMSMGTKFYSHRRFWTDEYCLDKMRKDILLAPTSVLTDPRELILAVHDYHGDQWEGFVISTNKQLIQIQISNGRDCCEVWGHIASQDVFTDFVGAELLDVVVTTGDLDNYGLAKGDKWEGYTMFVTLSTDRGPMQFTVYNDHNGYYVHDARVISTQLQYETKL